ncbi:MAG: acetyltransferase [Terriglobales bacterium]
MNPKRVFVYGAGGHGKVVADLLLARKVAGFEGFVDDRRELHGSDVVGLPVLGDGRWLLEQQAKRGNVAVALGIGNNHARRAVGERCLAAGIDLLTVVHPAAVVSGLSLAGKGTVVMAGAIVNPASRLGLGVIVNTGAIVEHDVTVGDYAHLAPNSTMGGAARIGMLSQLGIGATVLPGVAIGSATVIGAGAVVIRDLPDSVVAVGVPATVQKSVAKPARA